jgi:DNA-binding NtrC family response regulator
MAEGRVLLVDDEEDFVRLLAERMQTRGLAVHMAFSGAEALKLVEQVSFDAIVLDMVMPDMDGMETLRRLLQKDVDLQIIVLTGHAELQNGIEAIKQGAVDYLEKPADFNHLVSKIRDAQTQKAILFEKAMEQKIDKILRKKGW